MNSTLVIHSFRRNCLPLLGLGSCSCWTHFVHFKTYFAPFPLKDFFFKKSKLGSVQFMEISSPYSPIFEHFRDLYTLPTYWVYLWQALQLCQKPPLSMAMRAFKPGSFTLLSSQRFCLPLGDLYGGLGATVQDELHVLAGTDETETCMFLSAPQSLARGL